MTTDDDREIEVLTDRIRLSRLVMGGGTPHGVADRILLSDWYAERVVRGDDAAVARAEDEAHYYDAALGEED